MRQPNEFEIAIEVYAESTRQNNIAAKAVLAADAQLRRATDARAEAWTKVHAYIKSGKIKPGFYRLDSSTHATNAVGIMIQSGTDQMPTLTPMWRE